jgi:hypothetical protein
MRTLVDSDILPYEIGAISEGFHTLSKVTDKVDQLVEFILERTQATEYELFASAGGNFRLDVATVKQYKGQRASEKPKWFPHIRDYIYEEYDATPVFGCEADDMLSIKQRECNALAIRSCIASRDKDLRITPGWHYSWPCGEYQPEKPLYCVSRIGDLWPKWRAGKRGPTLSDLKGCGLKFFYSQLITGDTTDNYPGLPGKGITFAYQLLKDCVSEGQMYSRVHAAYREKYSASLGESGLVEYTNWRGEQEYKTVEELLLEQGRLAWMQEVEGQMWLPPHLRGEGYGSRG